MGEYDWIPAIPAIIISLVALYKAWKGNPGENADAMRTYQEMLDKATSDCKILRADVVLLQVENRTLRARISDLEQDVHTYRRGINRLIKQLESHEIKPAWNPDE